MGAIYFLACLHRISPTVIARDLVNEFGADATTLGLMASAYFYLYAAIQPLVGFLSDTIGPRRVVTIFTLMSCLGCLVFGSGPEYVRGRRRPGLDRDRGGRDFRAGAEDLRRLVQAKRVCRGNRTLPVAGRGRKSVRLPAPDLPGFASWLASFLYRHRSRFTVVWDTGLDDPAGQAGRQGLAPDVGNPSINLQRKKLLCRTACLLADAWESYSKTRVFG